MLRRLTRIFVHYAERYIPDPYIYALILTFVTAGAAFLWTQSDAVKIVTSWYDGIWAILAFAMQMALILATGVALADARPVRRVLQRVAAIPSQQAQAVVVLFLASAFANWLNWRFGLVGGALLAREMAKRSRNVDFGMLVAVAYMGNMVWASGLSSSIALASATPGSALNIIEKVTGQIAGFERTIFTAYNLVPTLLVFFLIPLLLVAIAPAQSEIKRADTEALKRDDTPAAESAGPRDTFASRVENTPVLTILLVGMGVLYEASVIARSGFSLDINGMIFFALLLGLIFHWRPIRYVRSFNRAARTVGPILLQFPLYAGIMCMMTGTGLAPGIARALF